MRVEPFYDRLKRYPPILCRLLARVPNGRPLGTLEIAEAAKMSPWYVEALSQTLDWDMVPVNHVQRFTEACGICLTNWTKLKKIEVYLAGKKRDGQRQSPTFQYLRRDPVLWQTYYQPLLIRFLKSRSANATAEGRNT